jgi:hypothetical protein
MQPEPEEERLGFRAESGFLRPANSERAEETQFVVGDVEQPRSSPLLPRVQETTPNQGIYPISIIIPLYSVNINSLS